MRTDLVIPSPHSDIADTECCILCAHVNCPPECGCPCQGIVDNSLNYDVAAEAFDVASAYSAGFRRW